VKKKNLLIISTALLVILACTFNNPTPTPEIPANNNSVATNVAQTLEASGLSLPSAALPTPLHTITPTLPPTITFTPTVAFTATPSVPVASVSVDTNCRTGPGKVYDYIGALLVGEKAEVVAKNVSSNYWVIKNPDANGNCWLWGYYATVAGNSNNLPVYAIPPTPTPSIPIPPSNLLATKNCVVDVLPNYKLTVNLTWQDNSNNEANFLGYADGILAFNVPKNQAHASHTVLAVDGVPVVFSVSANNTTAESAKATVQVICP
jgi:hypothetical protein